MGRQQRVERVLHADAPVPRHRQARGRVDVHRGDLRYRSPLHPQPDAARQQKDGPAHVLERPPDHRYPRGHRHDGGALRHLGRRVRGRHEAGCPGVPDVPADRRDHGQDHHQVAQQEGQCRGDLAGDGRHLRGQAGR